MGVINLAEIKEDMVLAGDIIGQNGRFLLAKGTKLTPKTIRILKVWGVIEADIERVTKEEVDQGRESRIDPLVLEAAKKETRKRYIHTDPTHPAMGELIQICTLRKAGEMIEKGFDGQFESPDPEQEAFVEDEILENETSEMNPAELLRKDMKLSTLPMVFMQINETINRPTSSANDIAMVIGRDTNLSAKLLRIVNSAFYGFPNKIGTLSRAVAIVGTKQLSTLAMGINVITAFKNIPRDLMDMKSFWEHSICCGIISRILAGHKGIQNSERLFVSGLLHDIGRLIFYNYWPINARNTLLQARRDKRLLYELELETMPLDHARMGAELLEKWRLPMSLENNVQYHHTPRGSKDPLEPAIIHLADIMANAIGRGSSGERFVPPLESEAWEIVGLSPNFLELTFNQLDRQFEEITRYLYSDEL
jgi:HD-like signal output (HDOD) protein